MSTRTPDPLCGEEARYGRCNHRPRLAWLAIVIALQASAAGARGVPSASDDSTPTAPFAAGFTSFDIGENPYSVAVGDLDEDGFPDLAVNDTHGGVVTLRGAAEQSFTTQLGFVLGVATWEVALADLDGDGHLDVVTAGNSMVAVALGHGDGTFDTLVPHGTASARGARGLAIVDLDGDGDLDVVTGNGSDGVSVRLGAGDGSLADPIDHALGFEPNVIAAGTFDAGVLPDLAITGGYEGTNLAVLLGDGSGGFGAPHVIAATEVVGVAVGDVNCDGKLDLVAGGATFAGHGDGSFGPQITFRSPAPSLPALGDLNGDGRLDIVSLDPVGVSVQLAVGCGAFGPAWGQRTGPFPSQPIVADVDLDGRQDVIAAINGGGTVDIFRGNGDGTLGARNDYPTGEYPIGLALADLTHDGRPDVVTADNWSDTISLLPGSGNATLGPAMGFAATPGVEDVAAGDVDGDGLVDIVTASGFLGTISIYLGTVAGDFSARQDLPAAGYPARVALADLDGDERADVVAWDPSIPEFSVRLTHGVALLGTAVDYPTGGDATATGSGSLVLADVDSDGALDVVVVESIAHRIRVFLGAGDGTFTTGPTTTLALADDLLDASMGRLDADGAADLVVLQRDWIIAYQGVGDGRFGAISYVAWLVNGASVQLADVNGDGRLDVLIAQKLANAIEIRAGHGDGTFGSAAGYGVGNGPLRFALGDLDTDGDPDLVVANQYSYDVSVLRNLRITAAVAVGGPKAPGTADHRVAFALDGTRPNPGRGVRVAFTIGTSDPARLELFDTAGRRVRTLEVGRLGPGRHVVDLAAGAIFAPGVYMIRLSQGQRTAMARACVVR